MNLWYFFQEQRLQCLESKLQKTQSKIETTEKEKDSCFYKINKFMLFTCCNLIGQFLAVFLLDLKEFLWIYITQIICLLFYFFTLF